MAKPKKETRPSIVRNRRARFDFELEDIFEAGVVLQGWEVKSIRAREAQLTDSYVLIRNGEAWLLGTHIKPLDNASTHIYTDPTRTRKLLLHEHEISRIFNYTQTKGYTCITTALYWKAQRVKCEIALAKGKRAPDKRAHEKDRDWKRQQERLMKRPA
jgi:SsrA-binding protein